MVYLFSRDDKELVGFEITLKNVPGALNKITNILREYYLNIDYIETYSKAEDEYTLFIAVDFKDSRTSPREILGRFKDEKEYVKEASIAPHFKNIIYPSKFYPMDIGGMRAILLGLADMKGLVEGIKEELGKKAGESLLYHLGYATGRKLHSIYAAPLKVNEIEEGVILLKALVRGERWGEITDYEIKEDKVIIKLEKLWECEIHKNKTNTPSGNYLKGILTGFFRSLLGREPIVEETKCIAIGDPYCQFEVRSIG